MKNILAAAVLVGVATLTAVPAHADDTASSFINSLSNAGLTLPNASDPVALGQSVCPMLSEPGQHVADAAAKVADASGMSLGPATMFTGLAISAFCPGVVSAVGNGQPPLPLGLLGF
ncbi:hypothetical protein ABIA30_001112 [Mycobacterium sp. MAA66]|uniref:DUF732 domain-containing protein n=1 Tax=Mycobacterium sp. MAA66 TaxID=3156297 RepID=UPI003514670F